MNRHFRNDPFYGITYTEEDYRRCNNCNEMELNCRVIDDEDYCESCLEYCLPSCEGCSELTVHRIDIEYDDAPCEGFKSEHHHERLCQGCADYITENPLEFINVKINGIV